MLYRGTKPGALYKGAYKPGKLYKGTQLIAGYADVSKAAPASWDGTYDDVVGVAAQGRGKQQTYSGKNLLMTNRETYTLSGVTAERLADGRYHISGTPTVAASLFLAQDLSLVLAAGTYTLARPTEAETLNIQARLLPGWKTGTFALGEALTVNACYIDLPASVIGQALDFVYAPQLETGTTPTVYEPYVGGQPSPSPDYPQPLVAAEGRLMSGGWTGTTLTAVTLPVLRAIPGTDIRDTLAYIGGGQWQVTRNVGVTVVDGETVKFTENAGGWWQLPWHSSPGALHNTDGSNNVGLKIRANGSYEFFYTLPGWLAAVGIESVDELNTLCQATAMTIWYALATPTTETLTMGALPSYPVYTELGVFGDYPPDVTGTVKVGT